MLKAFIDFTTSLFPSINPYIQEQTKRALEQFHLKNERIEVFSQKPFDYLSQGDILDGIPFLTMSEKGDISCRNGKGMIISNTCSCENNNDIVVAPMYRLDDLDMENSLSAIRDNLNYRLFYLPATDYDEYVVDFSQMNTINTIVLNNLICTGKIKKEKSLNQFGFYLFLTKLTICFMRPEDEGVQSEREQEFMNQHIDVEK